MSNFVYDPDIPLNQPALLRQGGEVKDELISLEKQVQVIRQAKAELDNGTGRYHTVALLERIVQLMESKI